MFGTRDGCFVYFIRIFKANDRIDYLKKILNAGFYILLIDLTNTLKTLIN
jgi:hypothetical protein